jgi:hypothetical protein
MVESISELQKKVTEAASPAFGTAISILNCSMTGGWHHCLHAGEVIAGGEQGSTEGSKLPDSGSLLVLSIFYFTIYLRIMDF